MRPVEPGAAGTSKLGQPGVPAGAHMQYAEPAASGPRVLRAPAGPAGAHERPVEPQVAVPLWLQSPTRPAGEPGDLSNLEVLSIINCCNLETLPDNICDNIKGADKALRSIDGCVKLDPRKFGIYIPQTKEEREYADFFGF